MHSMRKFWIKCVWYVIITDIYDIYKLDFC